MDHPLDQSPPIHNSPPRHSHLIANMNPKDPQTPDKPKARELVSTGIPSRKFLAMVVDPPLLKLQPKYGGCNCRKSECLKMYCVCFSSGKMCDESCLCDSCHNKTDNMRRSEAINEIITKDPFAFSRADSNKIQYSGEGCNCKKSNCSKKYCDCFRKGRECGRSCNCIGCANPCKEQVNKKEQVKAKKEKLA